MKGANYSVFINCPFDNEYREIFEAVHFCIAACGFLPRCALEVEDGAEARLSKLCRIIAECDRSVHDLSRTQVNKNGMPRFNMPFELGLLMGAKHFGGKEHARKSALILIEKQHSLPPYMSDLGGNDPSAHAGDFSRAVTHVRRYLGMRPEGSPLPGPKHILTHFRKFQEDLPALARRQKLEVNEVHPIDDFRTYAHFVAAFLQANPVL